MALCWFDGIQGGVLQRLGVRYVKVLRSWNMDSGSSGLGFWLVVCLWARDLST